MRRSRARHWGTLLILLSLALSGCDTGHTSARQYPVIPIPEGVFYQGASQNPVGDDNQDSGDIHFYTDQPLDMSSSSSSYDSWLRKLGWQTCAGKDCEVGVTDTIFLGSYQFGSGPDRVTMVVGRNAMIEPGNQISIFTKNCGKFVEIKQVTSEPATGCQVLLPARLREP